MSQNIWFINVLQFRTVSVALLPRPNPTPDSKSPCKGLSEFVVGLSGTSFFTRLDSGEQWNVKMVPSRMIDITVCNWQELILTRFWPVSHNNRIYAYIMRICRYFWQKSVTVLLREYYSYTYYPPTQYVCGKWSG